MILIILKCAYLQAQYCTCLIWWQLTVYAGCSLMCCRHYYHMALCMQNCVSMVLMLWEVAGCFLNSHKLHIPLKTHYENTRWSEWCHYKIVLAWQQAAKGERGKKAFLTVSEMWSLEITSEMKVMLEKGAKQIASCAGLHEGFTLGLTICWV